MKVGLVCPYDLGRFGGVQHQVIQLADWLRDAGHEALIVGPGESGPDGAALVGATTVVAANGAATPIRLDPRVAGIVAEAVADCEVVHVHEPLMPSVSLGATLRAAPPIVATFHADPPRSVVRLYRAGRRLLRRVMRRVQVATAVSPVAARAVPGVAVRMIPNGLDVAAYPTGPIRQRQVVFVGRDDPRKGLPVLLEAWPHVRDSVPDAELVVVGAEGDEPGIRFLGRVSEDEKRRVLGESDVFCAPNTHGESFGIVLAEAMAAGCAVVASAIPGFVYAAGEAAAFVRPGDPQGLADTLVGVITNDEQRDHLRNAGTQRVGRFDRATVLAAYVEAYHEAVAARSA